MFDANIFMVGIENRISNPNCSFENMKELYMIPLFESFQDIIKELMVDDIAKDLEDLQEVQIITFDVIVLLAFIFYSS